LSAGTGATARPRRGAGRSCRAGAAPFADCPASVGADARSVVAATRDGAARLPGCQAPATGATTRALAAVAGATRLPRRSARQRRAVPAHPCHVRAALEQSRAACVGRHGAVGVVSAAGDNQEDEDVAYGAQPKAGGAAMSRDGSHFNPPSSHGLYSRSANFFRGRERLARASSFNGRRSLNDRGSCSPYAGPDFAAGMIQRRSERPRGHRRCVEYRSVVVATKVGRCDVARHWCSNDVPSSDLGRTPRYRVNAGVMVRRAYRDFTCRPACGAVAERFAPTFFPSRHLQRTGSPLDGNTVLVLSRSNDERFDCACR
jgi:hypothetical protein